MERPIIVVIEGESFALSLCDYLAQFHNFAKIEYDGQQELRPFLDRSVSNPLWTCPRLAIARLHLTALVNRLATVSEFRAVDESLNAFGAKLVLAVGKKDGTGILADGYAHSRLDKRVHPKSAPVSHLLKWLGLRGQECSSSTFTGTILSASTTDSEPRSKRRPTPKN